MQSNFEQFRRQCSERVEQTLSQHLTIENCQSPRTLEAMRYATLNGGKRVRPLLVYASAEAMGLSANESSQKAYAVFLDKIACAIEMIHAYSLAHDDLPAMDDDNLRRGQPTLHIAFDEATAILAADALQARAFEIIATASDVIPHAQLKVQLNAILLLSKAAGLEGMVGGQMQDLLATDNCDINLQQLTAIHQLKTGALIKASILLGGQVTEINKPVTTQQRIQLANLEHYANHVGLAFQIRDDILDVVGDTETMGKQQGHDIADNKTTYVSLLGLDGAQQHLHEQCQLATSALQVFDDSANHLRQLVKFIASRNA